MNRLWWDVIPFTAIIIIIIIIYTKKIIIMAMYLNIVKIVKYSRIQQKKVQILLFYTYRVYEKEDSSTTFSLKVLLIYSTAISNIKQPISNK